MKLAKVIRTERLRLGLTQVELARAVRVGSDCISLYERGRMTPSVRTLRELARVFEKSIDEMLGAESAAA